MGYWTKHFADNTFYRGTDTAVKHKQASWRNSRSDNIVVVDIQCGGFLLKIEGLGEYWQSDMYEAVFPNPQPRMVKRRILRQIKNTDLLFRHKTTDTSATVVFDNVLDQGKCINIPSNWANKWFVLEYDMRTRSARHYIQENKE